MPYFNYDLHAHEASLASYWERREFLNTWWSLYRDDTRWTPPPYSLLSRELDPRRNDHLARLEATTVLRMLLDRTEWFEAADVGPWLPSVLARRREFLRLTLKGR